MAQLQHYKLIFPLKYPQCVSPSHNFQTPVTAISRQYLTKNLYHSTTIFRWFYLDCLALLFLKKHWNISWIEFSWHMIPIFYRTFSLIVSTLFESSTSISFQSYKSTKKLSANQNCKAHSSTSNALATSLMSFYNTNQERSFTRAIEKFFIGISRHFRAHKLTDIPCEHMTLTKTNAQ